MYSDFQYYSFLKLLNFKNLGDTFNIIIPNFKLSINYTYYVQ